MTFKASIIPMVIDSDGRGERAYDIYSLLLKERIVFLGTKIDDQVANGFFVQYHQRIMKNIFCVMK